MSSSDNRLHEAMDAVAQMVESHGVDQKGGKKYVQVVYRVEQLRRAFDTLVGIKTQILEDDGERVLMKATVMLGENVLGEGHAEELRGVGYVNKTSAVENCETSAIGRALAACGLAGGEYASANELDGVQRKEAALESKKKPSENPPPPDATGADATQPSRKAAFIQTKADLCDAYLTGIFAVNGDEARLKKCISRSLQDLNDGKITTRQQNRIQITAMIEMNMLDEAQGVLSDLAAQGKLAKGLIEDLTARIDLKRQGAEAFGGEV